MENVQNCVIFFCFQVVQAAQEDQAPTIPANQENQAHLVLPQHLVRLAHLEVQVIGCNSYNFDGQSIFVFTVITHSNFAKFS